jgi:uncharacterized membrane protein YeaQ/YmgE (transglycosylase-associated protein family)
VATLADAGIGLGRHAFGPWSTSKTLWDACRLDHHRHIFIRGGFGRELPAMGVIIWIILIGFVAGVIARFLMPGPNTPTGFVVTTLLGVAGSFLATAIGHAIGLYRHGQGTGLIGATIGALIILFAWNRLVASGIIDDYL